MEFFDTKEEVLEVVLTPFGRYKLTLGTFQPEYYAFFDDDIIYDIAWATGSASEAQNASEGRIQEETAYFKSPTAYTGINSTIQYHNKTVQSLILAKYGTTTPPFIIQDPVNGVDMIYDVETTQIYGDRFDFLSNTLGTSALSQKKYPTWALNMVKGTITGSTNYLQTARRKIDPYWALDHGSKFEQIPQINIDLKYNIYVDELTDPSLVQNSQYVDYNNVTFPIPGEVSPYDVLGEVAPNQFENAASEVFDDRTFYALENGKIIIDLLENNTDFKKENFEVQVFLSGSNWDDAYGNPLQLRFAPEGSELYNEDDVERYLFITSDSDIDSINLKKPPFADLTTFETEDTLSKVVSTRDFIIRDLYALDPDEEIC
jgi:hypothetical protein